MIYLEVTGNELPKLAEAIDRRISLYMALVGATTTKKRKIPHARHEMALVGRHLITHDVLDTLFLALGGLHPPPHGIPNQSVCTYCVLGG